MEPTQIQRDIINEDGNTVVLASPGSGKTFVMSEKIKRLLRSDDMREYQGVIAISYTRKASTHLKRKSLTDGVWEKNSFFGTIDSFCLTQIVLPFGNYVMGYPEKDVIPIDEKEFDKDRKEDFDWIGKIHPDYDDIKEPSWKLLYDLYHEGYVLINSLELMALHIIKKCSACRAHLKARFKYLFFDEYQDADTYTNGIFHELVGLGLIANAVGDPNQSIFGFAHKVSEYLEGLEAEAGFKAFRLADNFRCSTPIVNYSNRLLDANCEIIETDEEGVVLITVSGDESSVAEYLTNIISNDCEAWSVTELSHVAILVKNKTTQTYIDNNLELPHRVVASTPLDDDVNPRSRLFAMLLQFYFDKKMPFMTVLDEYADYDLFTKNVKQKLLDLRDKIMAVEEADIADEFPTLFKKVAEIVLPRYQEGSSLNHLQTVLGDKKQIDTYRPLKENEVVIMTLHKAKGLEFDIVYHLNMNEWELPTKLPKNGDFNDLYYPQYEQDLNLHFVGVTRARKLCALITSTSRHNSRDETKQSSPSEFLYLNGVEKMRKNYSYRKQCQ